MKTTTKVLVYVTGVLILSFASNSWASTWLHCQDKDMKKCEEVKKGQAVKIIAKDDKAIIFEIQRKTLSDKGTMVKNDD